MRRLAGFLLFLVTSLLSFGQPIVTTPPDKIYGKLFVDVQMNRVFPDGKTFVDCIPKRKPAEILADYEDIEREDILASLEFATKLSQVKRIEPTLV